MEHNAEGKSERDDKTDRVLCPDAWGGVCDTDCGYCGGSAYIKAGEFPDGLMHPRNRFPDPYAKIIGAPEGITHTKSLASSRLRHPSDGEPIIG